MAGEAYGRKGYDRRGIKQKRHKVGKAYRGTGTNQARHTAEQAYLRRGMQRERHAEGEACRGRGIQCRKQVAGQAALETYTEDMASETTESSITGRTLCCVLAFRPAVRPARTGRAVTG